MSLRVLVIMEDYRKDWYIAVPVIKAMPAHLKRPAAKVLPCKDPLLGGISQALDKAKVQEIIDRYRGMTDLFVLVVDRDNEAGRREALDGIEKFAAQNHVLLLAENAWQEIEVWALAAQDELPGKPAWSDVRGERDVKERYFEPLAKARELLREPGAGRKTLGEEAASRYASRLRKLCKEDVLALEDRVAQAITELG